MWYTLAGITWAGWKASGAILGSRVAVIGAGPIGQLVVRWLRAAGCADILVWDRNPARLELARRGGATAVRSDDITPAAAVASIGVQPEIVIDSTGNAAVLPAALGLCADRGRVVLLGDAGDPKQQTITRDVLTRGLTIVGAHVSHVADPKGVHRLFTTLAGRGQLDLSGLVTHRFSPEQAEAAYAAADTRDGSVLGVVFTWSKP